MDEITDVLVESGADADEARCVAEQIDGVDLDRLRRAIADGDAAATVDDIGDDAMEVLTEIGTAAQACGLTG